MCLEPHFLGVAPRHSRCKRFAVLKNRFKEAFRHNYQTSQYGSEATKQPQICIETSVTVRYVQLWAWGPGSLFLELLLLCNCHTVTEMQQRGCCFTKVRCWFCSFVELLHLCPPGWAQRCSQS